MYRPTREDAGKLTVCVAAAAVVLVIGLQPAKADSSDTWQSKLEKIRRAQEEEAQRDGLERLPDPVMFDGDKVVVISREEMNERAAKNSDLYFGDGFVSLGDPTKATNQITPVHPQGPNSGK